MKAMCVCVKAIHLLFNNLPFQPVRMETRALSLARHTCVCLYEEFWTGSVVVLYTRDCMRLNANKRTCFQSALNPASARNLETKITVTRKVNSSCSLGRRFIVLLINLKNLVNVIFSSFCCFGNSGPSLKLLPLSYIKEWKLQTLSWKQGFVHGLSHRVKLNLNGSQTSRQTTWWGNVISQLYSHFISGLAVSVHIKINCTEKEIHNMRVLLIFQFFKSVVD